MTSISPQLPSTHATPLLAQAAHNSAIEELEDDRVGFAHLPVELFKTEHRCWVLDSNRVEFVRVDNVAFDILRWLRKEKLDVDQLACLLPQHSREDIEAAFAEIISAQQQGFFVPASFRRGPRFDRDYYRSVLQDKMEGLTLSVTTRCNLSCSYCIFGGRYSRYPDRSQTTMSWSVLQSALDFLLMHSKKSKCIRVLFFGGEPLIAFPLIKRAVAYLRTVLTGDPRELQLAICTNGTILTDAILSFLVENSITIQFSVDGDSEIHDRDRRFRTSHRGSFDTILKNLKLIEHHNPDYFRRFVRVKGVIQSADNQAPMKVFNQYPIEKLAREHVSFVLLEMHYDISRDMHYFTQLERLGQILKRRRNVSSLKQLLQGFSQNQRQFFWQSYGWFFAAQAIERLGQRGHRQWPFSKGCMIGASEAHVGPDGKISICHKAQNGSAFVIGDVNESKWDFAKIDRLSEWLHSVEECSACFAQRFCDLCFEKLEGEEGLLEPSRTRFCRFMRSSLRVIFQNMLEVMDNNPQLWKEVVRYINQRVARERIKRQERLRESEASGFGGNRRSLQHNE
jgi:uncharacterized protein